jgi:BirA family biotin operon repressor/biotin-[acetyl-CoA-carboxylase] ligase
MTGRPSEALLALLADGELHSGAALAARLGVSRTAVWKLVAELRRLGMAIESLERRGYRLERPVELLDAGRMRLAAHQAGAGLPDGLEVLFEAGSTNDCLYAAPMPPAGRPRVVFAELQHAGRGRRGRSWVAPFGTGLTFKIAWTFAESPADLSALSLAMGVSVAEALRAAGAAETMLKWPNDIVWRQRKLGGLLIQLKSEAGGAACVVVGLGLNLALPDAARAALAAHGALPVGDLADAIGARSPGRNELAARLALAMLAALDQFGRLGFQPFEARWRALDSLAGTPVRVTQSGLVADGIALGADRDGALRLDVGGRVERVLSGDVSVRPAAAQP